MSIDSVTSRIKQIQSQINLVKPRSVSQFGSILNTETANTSDSEETKAQASDFTALKPMQNDTESSILQALINQLSSSSSSNSAADASSQQTVSDFNPDCEECVAELAQKFGYTKAASASSTVTAQQANASVETAANSTTVAQEQTQTAPANGGDIENKTDANSIVNANLTVNTIDNTDIENTVAGQINMQSASQPQETTDYNPNVITLEQQEILRQKAQNYVDPDPNVLTLEEQQMQQILQTLQIPTYDSFNPNVITLEQQQMAATSGTAFAQLQPQYNTEASYTTKVNVGDATISYIPGYMAYDPTDKSSQTNAYANAQSNIKEEFTPLSASQSTQQQTVVLPKGYITPVDYSITLPQEYSGAAQYMDIIKEASARYGMPVNLIVGIMKAESDFDNSCVSYAGAKGLMQLMPETAEEVGVTDVFDPRQNILGSVEYISKLINKYNGDVRLALAAYNTGPGNIQRKGVSYSGAQDYNNNVPESIRDYAERVLQYAGYIPTV